MKTLQKNTNEIKNKYGMFILSNSNYQYKYRLIKLNNILNQTLILCKQSTILDSKCNHNTV